MSARGISVGLALAVLACASACTAPHPDAPREWIEFGAGVADPTRGAAVDYGDALMVSLGGGYDLNDDPIVASWELGANWSQHDLDSGAGDVHLWRVQTGVRARARIEGTPLGVHARAGLEWRDESSDVVIGVDQWGTYAAAGLDWWYTPFASLGPELLWFHGQENGLDEVRFAILARLF